MQTGPPGKTYRDIPILFVDDDAISHRIMRRYLKGRPVTSVYSAREALSALEKENFVIVITDLMMPEMDGIELLREIKKKYHNRVHVIVITASDDVEHLIEALDAGAADFLLKPVTAQEMEVVLEHTLSRIERWNRALRLLLGRREST